MSGDKSEISRLYALNEKIFDKLDELVVITTKNTIILDEHHKRSTRLEIIQEDMNKYNRKIAVEVANINLSIASVQSEIAPIKKHVSNLGWVVTLTKSVPALGKLLFVVLSITSMALVSYHIYNYLL